MGINYRQVDSKATQDEALRNLARQALTDAYVAELEVERLTRSKSLLEAEDKPSHSRLDSAVSSARTNRSKTASFARAANKGGHALGKSEVQALQVDHLRTWLGNIEREHVAHTALLNQKESMLRDHIDDDDKEALGQEVSEHRAAIATMEVAHVLACERLDALAPVDDEDTEA